MVETRANSKLLANTDDMNNAKCRSLDTGLRMQPVLGLSGEEPNV